MGYSFAINPKDCRAASSAFGDLVFRGVHNTSGMVYFLGTQDVTDGRFFCFNNFFYGCGWELSHPNIVYNMADRQIVAGWMCNRTINASRYVGPPILDSPFSSNILNYSQSYSFALRNNIGYTGSYGILWRYFFYDGSSYDQIQSFSASSTANNYVTLTNSFVSPIQVNKTVSNVSVFGFYNDSLLPLSAAPHRNFIINYSACTNECNLIGEMNCTNFNSYKLCGNYDSDYCYEWSSNIFSCSSGLRCDSSLTGIGISNRCVNVGGSLTCSLNEGKFCSSVSPSNAFITTGDCGVAGVSCYECNVSAGYVLNPANNNSCLLNSCPAGQHVFGSSCISNFCGGDSPTGSNYTNGSAVFITGASMNWTYSLLPLSLGACQWSCNAGFKLNNVTNNSCVSGKLSCSELNGTCTNQSLAANMINISQYASCPTVSDSCVRVLLCDDSDNGVNYSLKGNVSFNYLGAGPLTLFEDRCQVARADGSGADAASGGSCSGQFCQVVDYSCNSDKNLVANTNYCSSGCSNGVCLAPTPFSCPVGKCAHNGSCFNPGFRISNTSGSFYCNVSSFISQAANGTNCVKDYECASNVCSSQGKCLDLVGTIRNYATVLDQIICFLTSGFSARANNAAYNSCLSTRQAARGV
jgi:hypothetical protein